jgi:hypothetical protein
VYRVRQFFWALGARMAPAAWAEVEEILTPAQAALFRQMPRYDQRHGLNVMRTLCAAGYSQPDLLTAALLHDVAKSSAPLRLWHRVAIVLLQAFAPRWLDWLAREVKPGHWRHPFYAHRVHAKVGARWAEEAGCSPLTVWLIAHHASSKPQMGDNLEAQEKAFLAALQRADGEN